MKASSLGIAEPLKSMDLAMVGEDVREPEEFAMDATGGAHGTGEEGADDNRPCGTPMFLSAKARIPVLPMGLVMGSRWRRAVGSGAGLVGS